MLRRRPADRPRDLPHPLAPVPPLGDLLPLTERRPASHQNLRNQPKPLPIRVLQQNSGHQVGIPNGHMTWPGQPLEAGGRGGTARRWSWWMVGSTLDLLTTHVEWGADRYRRINRPAGDMRDRLHHPGNRRTRMEARLALSHAAQPTRRLASRTAMALDSSLPRPYLGNFALCGDLARAIGAKIPSNA